MQVEEKEDQVIVSNMNQSQASESEDKTHANGTVIQCEQKDEESSKKEEKAEN